MGTPTECWTLKASELPNDAVACSLSQVLMTGNIPPKYFLSQLACQGILGRAERRGRRLPEPLRSALLRVAEGTSFATTQAVRSSLASRLDSAERVLTLLTQRRAG